ncbi:MAG: matrixin family metalloprotease [Deltaproteobacteria bacterium]|nr:matrixin family metalloprotease [Deltaproteobacteria bacterium]
MKKTCTAALLAACLAFAAPASAYKYTKCGAFECEWPQYPIGYLVGENLESLFPGASDVAVDSLTRWNEGVQTFCDIRLNFGGTTTKAVADDDFDNIIFAQTSDWPYGTQVLAVTQCFFNSQGTMLDCDIAVNAQDWQWTDTNPGGHILSLRDTLTHEAGHFWGLDHTPTPAATMNATYSDAYVAADLDEDDIRGASDRYCDGSMPSDDGEEQNDSLKITGNPFEETTLTGLRLYDDDVWKIQVADGRFPKIEVLDNEPARHKHVAVFDLNHNLLGSSPCDGDCVVAPTLVPVATVQAFIRIQTDFARSGISAETYDMRVTQVTEVSQDELTDDDENDSGSEAQDNDEACGCSVMSGEAGGEPAAMMLLVLAAAVLWTVRRRC